MVSAMPEPAPWDVRRFASLPSTNDFLREQARAGCHEGLVAVTCSIGVSQTAAGVDANRLIREADEAMYRAKQRGRNCVMQ